MSLAWVSRTHAAPQSTSNTTLAATATAHVTGNALFALIHGNTSSFTATITDTALNTFTLVDADTDGAGFYAIYEAHDITGNAANVVTAVLSSGQEFAAMVVHEASGFGTEAPAATTGYGSGTSDGSANAPFASLEFSGSDALYLGLGICQFEFFTSGLHPGATVVVFGEDVGITFPFFKDVRHLTTSPPHQCGVNLTTGISEAYRYGAVVLTAGTEPAPPGTVLMGQGIM